ncbi:glycosyltransferase family 4 protein [Halogeometricum pallidum]|uniref:glycosyltransferase family 4 protein n=1 Tax=Halogeometricum pallidum TaxID=411361 RepID=UPI000A065967|nr:glycosyltransferase family 4 protein [Halogeometricum pallidum]
MNVCILGERSEQLDEGMKNFGIQLHDRLNKRGIDATLLDLREIGSADFWLALSRASPDIVHLVPGPTAKGLVLLRALSTVKQCKTVATVTQPRFSPFSRRTVPYLRPSLMYVQSKTEQSRFNALGCTTEFLPSGVNLTQFSPNDENNQTQLRNELGLPSDKRIFLHVGHFKRGRGIESLLELQAHGHLVIVGSPSTGPEADLVESLRSTGVTIQTEYVPEIEKYYQIADIYVFPVTDEANSIQAPLSVLEAMACNLPVISTRFGGLTDLFDEGEGLRFISSFAGIEEGDLEFDTVETRDKVSKYSWDAIVSQVLDSYNRICNAEH